MNLAKLKALLLTEANCREVVNPLKPKEKQLEFARMSEQVKQTDEVREKTEAELKVIKLALQRAETALQNTGCPYPTDESLPADWNQALQDYYWQLLQMTATHYLAFAVIEDDRKTVKAILASCPELLLYQGLPLKVTSELTAQSFSVPNILGIACRRKQIEMVKILLPYFSELQEDKPEEVDEIEAIKNVGLAEWLKYPLDAEKNIKVPGDYQALIDGLIDVFKAENIAAGAPVNTLSANVETAMNVLYERLLPGITNPELAPENRPVMTKENHLDVELLLYAAYKAYDKRFNEFQTWEQRRAYCIRVIGIVQNFLPPETGKIFCEGLYYVVEENRKISARAESLKLDDEATNFYGALDLVLRKGLGFDYLRSGLHALVWRPWSTWRADHRFLEKSVKQKQQLFETYPATPAINTSAELRA